MFSTGKSNRNISARKMKQEVKSHRQAMTKVLIEDMPTLCDIMSDDSGSTISSMSGPRKSDASFASAKDSTTENSESSIMVMNYLQSRNDDLKKVNCQLEAEKERLQKQLESLTGRRVNPMTPQRPTRRTSSSLVNSHETELGVELVPKGKEMRITTKVTRPTKKGLLSDSTKKEHHSSSSRRSTRRRKIDSKASF